MNLEKLEGPAWETEEFVCVGNVRRVTEADLFPSPPQEGATVHQQDRAFSHVAKRASL